MRNHKKQNNVNLKIFLKAFFSVPKGKAIYRELEPWTEHFLVTLVL